MTIFAQARPCRLLPTRLGRVRTRWAAIATTLLVLAGRGRILALSGSTSVLILLRWGTAVLIVLVVIVVLWSSVIAALSAISSSWATVTRYQMVSHVCLDY